jgi:hypothetical protein
MVINGEYIFVGNAKVAVPTLPTVPTVAVHVVPAGVAITNDVADVTLTIGYQPVGNVPVVIFK